MERHGKIWKRYDNKKTPLTEEEIESILAGKYSNVYPKTKEYIRNGLRTIGPKFKFRMCQIVRDDLIEQYKLVRISNNLPIFDYDFSLVPEIINGEKIKFDLICKNTIGGKMIGKFTTSFYELVINKLDCFNRDKFLDYTKFTEDDINLEKTQNLINKLSDKILETFDISEVAYINSYTPIKLICKTCGNIIWRLPKDCTSNIKSFHRCPKCSHDNNSARSLEKRKQHFITIAKEAHGDASDYSKIKYTGRSNIVRDIICNNCGNLYDQYPTAHINSPYGFCPDCCKKIVGEKGRSNINNVKEKSDERYGDIFDWSKAVYVTNQIPITLIEKATGEEFEITPNHLMFGVGLPIWHVNSWGERNARKWFLENNIVYKSEVTIETIEGRHGEKSSVRIEFIIDSEKVWIEFNGKQHYEFIPNFPAFKDLEISEAKKEYMNQLRRDENIRNYCKENNITLVEIPYTYYDYPEISNILERILINHESPDFIIQPEIQYVDNKE